MALFLLVVGIALSVTLGGVIALMAQALKSSVDESFFEALQEWGVFYSIVMLLGTAASVLVAQTLFSSFLEKALFIVGLSAWACANAAAIHQVFCRLFARHIVLKPHLFLAILMLTCQWVFERLGVDLSALERVMLAAEHNGLLVLALFAVAAPVVQSFRLGVRYKAH